MLKKKKNRNKKNNNNHKSKKKKKKKKKKKNSTPGVESSLGRHKIIDMSVEEGGMVGGWGGGNHL